MDKISKVRSDELTEKALDFLSYKQSYQAARENSHYQEKKQRLLSYFQATEDDWNDWHWQMRNRIDNTATLNALFTLTETQQAEIEKVSGSYRWSVTPYYLALIERFYESDPIYLQAIPMGKEMDTWGKTDPMGEEHTNPSGSITRRYPDRLIINVTNCCAMFCRHCQRRRNIGNVDEVSPKQKIDDSIEYIRQHPEIRDVLITGGDPLTLEDNDILSIVERVRAIPTVEIIRIGTRTLVTMPQRITDELADKLQQYAPLYINTQFNHPNEITPETRVAAKKLASRGIYLGNQMVLLNQINDDAYTVRLMNHMLLTSMIRPYYIFHPKEVIGTKHFSVPIKKGLEIVNSLRGHTSGLAIPTYICNAPNGLGKIPLQRNNILSMEDHEVHLLTWEDQEVVIHEVDEK